MLSKFLLNPCNFDPSYLLELSEEPSAFLLLYQVTNKTSMEFSYSEEVWPTDLSWLLELANGTNKVVLGSKSNYYGLVLGDG